MRAPSSNKYGSTEVSGSPERVVSLGYQEHDFLLALGVEPVAVRYWYGDENDVIFPWAEDEAGDAEPEILNMPEGLNFERIAALEPDLIVGLYSGMTEDDYGTLSEIAPTIAQLDEYINYGMPWQDTTTMLGRVLGREDRATELVAGVEAQFEEARRQHPEFEGKSLAVTTRALGREDRADELVLDLERRFAEARGEYPDLEGATVAVIGAGDGLFCFYTEEDRSTSFFTALGLGLSEEAASLSEEGRFAVEISEEQFRLADADVLVLFASTPADEKDIRASELFANLSAVREDRVVYLSENDDPVKGALSFNTVLSTPYLLDNLVPKVADMVRRAQA